MMLCRPRLMTWLPEPNVIKGTEIQSCLINILKESHKTLFIIIIVPLNEKYMFVWRKHTAMNRVNTIITS